MDGLVETAAAGFDSWHAAMAIVIVVEGAAIAMMWRQFLGLVARVMKGQQASTQGLASVNTTLEIIKDRLPR